MVNKIDIILDFITEEQESQLLKFVPSSSQRNYKGRNRILRYGSDKAYGNNIVNKVIPVIFNQFKSYFDFDSVTINEYFPEQLIDWHIDKPSAGLEIIVLSLLSDANIKFRKDDKIESYKLPRRSLVRFSEEIRNEWEHSLKAVDKRYSIVFRNSKI